MKSLNQIMIASPCGESWAAMEGDERQRHCKVCQKSVYNLSSMTEEEGLALLAEKEGNLCVRFRRRQDGTIITSDCPVGQMRARKRRTVSFGWAAALVASGSYIVSRNATAVQFVERTTSVIFVNRTMGAPAMPAINMPPPAMNTQKAPKHNVSKP